MGQKIILAFKMSFFCVSWYNLFCQQTRVSVNKLQNVNISVSLSTYPAFAYKPGPISIKFVGSFYKIVDRNACHDIIHIQCAIWIGNKIWMDTLALLFLQIKIFLWDYPASYFEHVNFKHLNIFDLDTSSTSFIEG